MCKSVRNSKKMRRSGQIVRQVLESTRAVVLPGSALMDLERVAEKKISELARYPRSRDTRLSPLLCTSIKQRDRARYPVREAQAQAGDIVSIDCGVVLDGYLSATRRSRSRSGR